VRTPAKKYTQAGLQARGTINQ